MNKTLEGRLFRKYPKIFRQKDLPKTETCMCWGVSCGDGWYWLIDSLCSCIQSYINHNKKPQLEATQVKEKFAGLRFYTNHSDETIEGMIQFAMHLSYRICEKCGSTDTVTQTMGGWIFTRCKKCKEVNGA